MNVYQVRPCTSRGIRKNRACLQVPVLVYCCLLFPMSAFSLLVCCCFCLAVASRFAAVAYCCLLCFALVCFSCLVQLFIVRTVVFDFCFLCLDPSFCSWVLTTHPPCRFETVPCAISLSLSLSFPLSLPLFPSLSLSLSLSLSGTVLCVCVCVCLLSGSPCILPWPTRCPAAFSAPPPPPSLRQCHTRKDVFVV